MEERKILDPAGRFRTSYGPALPRVASPKHSFDKKQS